MACYGMATAMTMSLHIEVISETKTYKDLHGNIHMIQIDSIYEFQPASRSESKNDGTSLAGFRTFTKPGIAFLLDRFAKHVLII